MTDYYARRLADPGYRNARARRAELIHEICADRLAGAGRVVDLGAGTGLVKRALEERIGRPIVGIEIDPTFIIAPERMVVADLLRLPVPDGGIDFGIANHVYEHVADLEGFFAELARVLAPGGAAYMTAGNRFALLEPHYRIPTLSWWPARVSDALLRLSGRGRSYAGIRFTTHRRLVGAARRQGLAVDDLTDRVLAAHLDRYERPVGRGLGRVARRLPGRLRRRLLDLLAPQWFLLVRRADGP